MRWYSKLLVASGLAGSLLTGEADAQFLCQIRTPAGWVQQGYIPHGYAGPMVFMRNGYPLAGSYFRGYFRTGGLSLNFSVYEAQPVIVRQYEREICPPPASPRRYRHAPRGVTEEEIEDILYHELDESGIYHRWKKYLNICNGRPVRVDAQARSMVIDVVPTEEEAIRRMAAGIRGYRPLIANEFDTHEEAEGAVKYLMGELRRDP